MNRYIWRAAGRGKKENILAVLSPLIGSKCPRFSSRKTPLARLQPSLKERKRKEKKKKERQTEKKKERKKKPHESQSTVWSSLCVIFYCYWGIS